MKLHLKRRRKAFPVMTCSFHNRLILSHLKITTFVWAKHWVFLKQYTNVQQSRNNRIQGKFAQCYMANGQFNIHHNKSDSSPIKLGSNCGSTNSTNLICFDFKRHLALPGTLVSPKINWLIKQTAVNICAEPPHWLNRPAGAFVMQMTLGHLISIKYSQFKRFYDNFCTLGRFKAIWQK